MQSLSKLQHVKCSTNDTLQIFVVFEKNWIQSWSFQSFSIAQFTRSKLNYVILSDNISRGNMAKCDLVETNICARHMLHVFLWLDTVNSGAFMLQFFHLSRTSQPL